MIPKITDQFRDDPSSGGRLYKNALLNTLIHLKPKVCLEIGSYYYGSAKVFQYYFNTYCPDGLLLTCDIKKYVDYDLPNVKFLQVSPHVSNTSDWHAVADDEMIFAPERVGSRNYNVGLIEEELAKHGYNEVDFSWLDGDHQEKSFWADYDICDWLTDGYIAIDDIDDDIHDSARTYKELIAQGEVEHYEYADWEGWVGMGLVWRKNEHHLRD